MCGIAGIIAPEGIRHDHLVRMSTALQHRGPDGSGVMLYSRPRGLRLSLNEPDLNDQDLHDLVGFAHRRLSIFDLSDASLQPMVDERGCFCVTYNGELYNYLDLRQDLEALGYSFQTTGDTEVLLRAYEAWGPDCLQRFNGMWAFAILDLRDHTVFLARDRFGIKPLYWTTHQGACYFASEIKGLLAVPGLRPQPNDGVVAQYLATGMVDNSNQTFFNSIEQFPAAHWASIPLGSYAVQPIPRRYWSIPHDAFAGSETEATAQLRDLFLDAVRLHAQSDVPVGSCLSGGIDSSAIVCTAELLRASQQIPHYSHNAFGFCAQDEKVSERRYMDMVAAQTSARMHYVNVSESQVQQHAPDIIRMQDEPFGSASIVAQWFVFQRAKSKGMTVMLDGQGADETLAGYHTYFATIAGDYLAHGRFAEYQALRSRFQRDFGPFPVSHKSLMWSFAPTSVREATRLAKRGLVRSLPRLVPGDGVETALSSDLWSLYAAESSRNGHVPRRLRDALQISVESTGLPSLLRFEDRNSMAHSIEARVPFLDHRLVEFLFGIPDAWKVRDTRTKFLFREAMTGILPEPIRSRTDKIGFRADPSWTHSFVRQHRQTILHNASELERRWFNAEGLETLVSGISQASGNEHALWRVLNTKIWARQQWGDM